MDDTLSSLRRRLASSEQSLRLIRERRASYVLAEDVPLQLVKNERELEDYIARLRASIEILSSAEGAPTPAAAPPAAPAANGQEQRWTIFLCHAPPDKAFADWLYHKLHSADLTVWYAEYQILVGDRISTRQAEGLRSSDLLLVVLSQAALESRWATGELAATIRQHAAQDATDPGTILPLVVGPIDPALLPGALQGRRQLVFPPGGSDEQFRELLASIEQHLQRRGLLRARRIANPAPGPVASGPNPFGLRGGVEPERFIVPVRLVREVTEDIVKHQSIAIVGARMMGKTSLLKFLCSERCRPSYQDEQGMLPDLRFVFIDLQEQTGAHRDTLVPLLAQAMSQQVAPGARFGGGGHQEALAWIKATAGRSSAGGPHWVLLFDEFDRIVELVGLDRTLFDELRSLPQHYRLSFVVAARRKLIDLPLPRSASTSPFFNLFKEFFLGVWDGLTTQSLMLRPQRERLDLFGPEDIGFLTQLTARHPLLLQIGCYHLFNARRAPPEVPGNGSSTNGAGTPARLEQFHQYYLQEAESVYRYYWQHELEPVECAWLRDCWRALVGNNTAVLATLQRNTAHRKNHTIRVRLAKLGAVLGSVGPIDLPTGWQAFLEYGA